MGRGTDESVTKALAILGKEVENMETRDRKKRHGGRKAKR